MSNLPGSFHSFDKSECCDRHPKTEEELDRYADEFDFGDYDDDDYREEEYYG